MAFHMKLFSIICQIASFIYRADPNNVVVSDGEVTAANPQLRQASTASVHAGDFDDISEDEPEEAPKKMTFKEVFEELERFEGELFEASSIIQFIGIKMATMKNIVRELADQRQEWSKQLLIVQNITKQK